MKQFLTLLISNLCLFSICIAQPLTGCVSGNCENGYGVYIWKSGTIYAGNWVKGKKHYFGVQIWPSGTAFMGIYKDDERQNRGWFFQADGERQYLSEKILFKEQGCVSGNCEAGYGVHISENGSVYAGFWRDGQKNYFGTQLWSRGSGFWGVFKDNERQKRGLYTWPDGESKYDSDAIFFNESGCVSGNCQDSVGVYIWKSGSLYAGIWLDAEKHFFGTQIWENGTSFRGLYSEGNRTGRGQFQWPDGSTEYNTEEFIYKTTPILSERKE